MTSDQKRVALIEQQITDLNTKLLEAKTMIKQKTHTQVMDAEEHKRWLEFKGQRLE